jgi:hypothetical protein
VPVKIAAQLSTTCSLTKGTKGIKQVFLVSNITDEEVTKMSKGTTQMSCPGRSTYIFFHPSNHHRRVIHLGFPFFDRDDCLQAETNRMSKMGDVVSLDADESSRLAHKIVDLKSEFRSNKAQKGRHSAEGHRLSLRELVEAAMREVFAGVPVGSGEKL